MSAATPFTAQEFWTELLDFRALFGQRTFWARPQWQRQAAVNAMGFLYLNLRTDVPEDEMKKIQTQWSAALYEYTRREILAIQHGLAGKE